MDPTGPRRPDNVVDPTGPRRPDNVVDPTGPRRKGDVMGEETGGEREVGKVVGYFGKVGVAAVEATAEFAAGETLHFKGHTTDFTVTVVSMQVDGKPVEKAGPGDKVGVKVLDKARDGDKVYR